MCFSITKDGIAETFYNQHSKIYRSIFAAKFFLTKKECPGRWRDTHPYYLRMFSKISERNLTRNLISAVCMYGRLPQPLVQLDIVYIAARTV